MSLSRVRLLATPWTAAYQAPPSMGFSRQEYWSGLPLPFPITAVVPANKHRAPATTADRISACSIGDHLGNCSVNRQESQRPQVKGLIVQTHPVTHWLCWACWLDVWHPVISHPDQLLINLSWKSKTLKFETNKLGIKNWEIQITLYIKHSH